MNAKRQHMQTLMRYLLGHEPTIHYLMRRPMRLTDVSETWLRSTLDSGGGIYSDCSEMVTAICRWAKLEDPSGMGYDGYGNTETMLAHLPRYYDPKQLAVGGLVHYVDPEHVSICLVPDPVNGNPTLFSMGAEDGPRTFRLNTEHSWHPGQVTCLSISPLL